MAILLGSSPGSTVALATALDTALQIALADRASMRNHRQAGVPAVLYLGSVNDTLSDVHQEAFVGLDGYDAMAATAAEDTALVATDPTINTANITTARAGLMRSVSDFFVMVAGKRRGIDINRLAASMVGEYDAYWMSLLAATVATTTNNSGQSGVNYSVSDFLDAMFALMLRSVPGPFFELNHPRQHTDFLSDLVGVSGPLQFLPATAEQLQMSGPGLQGKFLNVEKFTSTKITASGGNRLGAMWGAGALGYRTGTQDPPVGVVSVRPDAEILVEFEREGKKTISNVLGHAFVGQGIREQDRIEGVQTDQ